MAIAYNGRREANGTPVNNIAKTHPTSGTAMPEKIDFAFVRASEYTANGLQTHYDAATDPSDHMLLYAAFTHI